MVRSIQGSGVDNNPFMMKGVKPLKPATQELIKLGETPQVDETKDTLALQDFKKKLQFQPQQQNYASMQQGNGNFLQSLGEPPTQFANG